MRGWRRVDTFQAVTTVLLIVLGVTIVVRAAARHAPVDSYGLGAAFVVYGVYRLRYIVRALRQGRISP
jgi:threonine/homoserine efflux transporter RhtA